MVPGLKAALRREALALRDQAAAGARRRLDALRPGQRDRFERLQSRCGAYWDGLRAADDAALATRQWADASRELERLMPRPPFDFLRDPLVAAYLNATMLSRGTFRAALTALRRRFSEAQLRELLAEDPAGEPPLAVPRYLSSHGQVFRLNALLEFENTVGRRAQGLRCIVEWGGGCGGMAALWRRLNPAATYVVVDLGVVSCLQWLRLASIFGARAVRLVTTPGRPLAKGAIHLLPVRFLPLQPLPRPDLFLSTFALNESPQAEIARVSASGWFRAKHLLVAYAFHPYPASARRLEKALRDSRAAIRPPAAGDCGYFAFR